MNISMAMSQLIPSIEQFQKLLSGSDLSSFDQLIQAKKDIQDAQNALSNFSPESISLLQDQVSQSDNSAINAANELAEAQDRVKAAQQAATQANEA